jgi:rhamnulokinase
MPERIRSLCVETGQRPPAEPAEVVRCILDSLAAAYARAVADAVRLSGQEVDVLHLVGGGARNSLLCRLTAEACGVPVLAGPVEATALGNVLVQARAYGALSGDLAQLRSVLSTSLELQRFEPGGPATAAGGVR